MIKPPLIVTMGDPSGIGPEIVATALAHGNINTCVVAGSVAVMREAILSLGLDLKIEELSKIEQATGRKGCIEVLETGGDGPFPVGEVSPASGRAAYDAIVAAIKLAKDGRAAGIVTAPIHKEALSAAGVKFPGHTEMLAEIGGADRVAMMLANEEVRTVLVTVHCSLRDAIDRADHAAQMSAIRLAHEGCRALGIEKPRVAVAGLNPHAGEGGLFGREEIEIIAPAIKAACDEGIDASGPWPSDTVFMQARRDRFDVVVAQYHDQGLIPVKYLGVEKGVNITLGLPFVRTSPDHGTAFDIAGKGIADATSQLTAIDYARRLIATDTKKKETA
ncbi:4-hydroxythreonine-4-phosphate dehydrogenase PdxA [Ruegeria sp. EL01]|jgi:4-hydroxythreonine-4-phosphate dehydrogenase|uniref:4-hydroxythreonine-4-phosphate dehydrogenase PdxA n=1 Tax=Ruegeria sp. EL01 TaxID=2107578 RepID=UPI000EA7F90C|nr:4-hydroxythreonine-4-phosphate dehydrogenase PdxA [Ruegeria sp. EL01]